METVDDETHKTEKDHVIQNHWNLEQTYIEVKIEIEGKRFFITQTT